MNHLLFIGVHAAARAIEAGERDAEKIAKEVLGAVNAADYRAREHSSDIAFYVMALISLVEAINVRDAVACKCPARVRP